MKQITIYELLPLLRPGWVAMDEDGQWCWFGAKPVTDDDFPFQWTFDNTIENWDTKIVNLSFVFNIAPFDGDWKDSLMECGNGKQN